MRERTPPLIARNAKTIDVSVGGEISVYPRTRGSLESINKYSRRNWTCRRYRVNANMYNEVLKVDQTAKGGRA